MPEGDRFNGIRMDRRRLLMGLAIGAAGVGSGVVAMGSSATEALAADAAGSVHEGGHAQPFALPAPTPGLTSETAAGYDYHGTQTSEVYTYVFPGGLSWSSGDPWLLRNISAPHGAVIKEALFVVTNPGPATLGMNIIVIQPTVGISMLASFSYTTKVTAPTAVPVPIPPGGITVDTTKGQYMMAINVAATGSPVLYGSRVGWVSPVPGFHPVAPARVYDSRFFDGPLSVGSFRTVRVADSIDSNTGGVTNFNYVPAGATAVTYNLTVANTSGAGYLALFPAGTTYAGNSSINWSADGLQLANGGVVTLGGDRQINVYCGGGATQFVVDVTGYYL